MQALSNRIHGFTTIELIVVLAVSGIIFSVVMNALGGYYRDNSISLGRGVQETETRSVLRSIEKDLYSSIGFGAGITDRSLTFANSAPFGSGSSSSNPWRFTTNGYGPVLIAYKNPVTRQADKDTSNTRLPVFLQPVGGCGNLINATPALMVYIYFVGPDFASSSKRNLYRRIIVPNSSATPLCGTTVPAYSSCAINNTVSYPEVCRAPDSVMLKDIKSFEVNYFDPGARSPYVLTGNSTIDDRHINSAQAVEIEVEMYQRHTNDHGINTTKANIRINHQ